MNKHLRKTALTHWQENWRNLDCTKFTRSFFFDCGGEITHLSFGRHAQEVDPRWLVRVAYSKVLSGDPLLLGSSDQGSPTHHMAELSRVTLSVQPISEGPSDGLEYEETLSYQIVLGCSSSTC